MDVPQYEHVDVYSDNFCHGMFYYTNHSDMGTSQYVQADVPLELSVA
jgi:hypothetical protein